MKKLAPFIIALFVMLFNSVYAQDWQYDFEEAKTLAKENDKNIVLLFTGSDWCAPCIRLERNVLGKEEFKEFAEEHFVMLKADFPKRKKNKLPEAQEKKNFELAKRYNKRLSFPVILVLDKEGKVLGVTGYRKMSVDRYISLLTSFEG